MPNFELESLDHVAIRVADLEISAEWYQRVLGLKRYLPPEWEPWPIFMMSGKFGVALFPSGTGDHTGPSKAVSNIRIDHFAFNVSNHNFDKAEQRYQELGLEYEIQDHHYFRSMYTKDPDGHVVELTTIVVDEESFYRNFG